MRDQSKVEAPLLGLLASGEAVLDSEPSHLAQHPGVKEFLGEALRKVVSVGRLSIAEEVHFPCEIGLSSCVRTGPGDKIVFARRLNRMGRTRFVLNRDKEPTASLSLVLAQLPDGAFQLITAFFGPLAPPEPWDSRATPDSHEFWEAHALVWDESIVVPGTLLEQ